jgi:hypothetical protein
MTEGRVQVMPRLDSANASTQRREQQMQATMVSSAPMSSAPMVSSSTNDDFAPLPTKTPVSPASLAAVSNEYWLIGIIIVLIAVILMLIVYVVKVRQDTPIKGSVPPGTKDPGKEQRAIAEAEQLKRISQQPFVAHSQQEEGADEAQGEDTADTSSAQETQERPSRGPLFTMCRDPGHEAATQEASAAPQEGVAPQGATQGSTSVAPTTPVQEVFEAASSASATNSNVTPAKTRRPRRT